jgi:hypothetical protein
MMSMNDISCDLAQLGEIIACFVDLAEKIVRFLRTRGSDSSGQPPAFGSR